jgi:hypothetical protein
VISPAFCPHHSPSKNEADKREIVVDGVKFRAVNMMKVTYRTSNHKVKNRGALINRGCNGGICGSDARIIYSIDKVVDVQGISNHCLTDIPIVTAGAVVKTQRREITVIMNQYAHMGQGKTIHSSAQLEVIAWM